MPVPKPIKWTEKTVCKPRTKDESENGDNANNEATTTTIQVSNPNFVAPEGLEVFHNFISTEEAWNILKETDNDGISFAWEGFEQRKKVQRYSVSQQNDDEKLPSCLKMFSTRFEKETGYHPTHITFEEYPRSQLQKCFNMYQSTVTTFESSARCSSIQEEKSCFVGVIPICCSVIQNINRPKRRFADCWDLYSPNHSTGILLNQHSLYVSTGELLWEWRTRISAVGPDVDDNSRFLLIKLYKLPSPSCSSSSSSPLDPDPDMTEAEFGYMLNPKTGIPRTVPMPPLQDILTIIVTTSPIRSNPSTELLERVFETFKLGGDDFALCRKIIVCDGCRQRTEKTTKKHSNIKQAMRNGIVDEQQYIRYNQFKANLRKLCENASDGSPFSNASVEELESRLGYGFALRHALRERVETPYVIVIQHDRTFMRPTPVYETVRAMWRHQNIKYVGFSMRSNLLYKDIFLGKYHREHYDAMAKCILHPSELMVDADEYGPNSNSTGKMEYSGNEKLRKNIHALVETYKASQQNIDHMEWLKSNPIPDGKWQLSLTPTFFWYDNVHVCETAHYRDFIFDPRYKMVSKGGFVEDKLSPVLKKTVERFGLIDGHSRFGCFLLDDHSGYFFTGHLDGGNYLCDHEKRNLIPKSQSNNDM